MRFSVVINTYNRAPSLRQTLDALRHQTFADFEVVVVNGPSTDGTAALLAERADELRVVDCPERVLGVSRNLGIDAAAGDVVAFVDDDGVPEPRWLADLDRAYDSDRVGGAGGLTLDPSGTRAQYRYAVCDRLGATDFDQEPPLDRFNRPGAEPFLYLQGTNCSFRRDVLERVDGFDEHFEYIFDESELASRVIDSGYELRALADAVVHHKFLPSHLRAQIGGAVSVTDPYVPIKNRTYFALRVGRDHHSLAVILSSLTRYMDGVKAWARDVARRGLFTRDQLDFWLRRADEGMEKGVAIGLSPLPRTRPIAPRDPDAFRPYPTRAPADGGRRLCVAFATLDFPPRPMGGIARFTSELARGFAEAGHEAHVVTRDDAHSYRMDFEDGVWVHRFPVGGRRVHGVDGHPLEHNLDHVAAVRNAVERVAERAPLDVMTGSLWIGEPLLCALDPRWVTTVVCNTPMRKIAELQPETAAASVTPWQIAVEDATLHSPAHLQPVSQENERLCRELAPEQPMRVIWHGVDDQRDAYPRRRPDDAVEVLFVGRLEPRKGIDTLLEAARLLLADRPDVHVRILGGDNPHANGRPDAWPGWVAVHAADLADRIVFEGEVSDERLRQALADCDVFCAPSRYESFGLVHVEAMMIGRPVVACAAGGMTETVVDGETGMLVAPGAASELAAALAALVDDAGLRERMGAAGRARYEAEFRTERAVERNVAFYRELVEAHVAPAPREAARIVHERTRALVGELCDLDPETAGEAAEALLDADRFPVDCEHGALDAMSADNADFVAAVYRMLLDREADPGGLRTYAARLEAGLDRVALVREIARSPEAKANGVDPAFVRRLPTVELADAQAAVRTAWLHDDERFVADVRRLLAGPAAARDGAATVAALADGSVTRAEVLEQLVARRAATQRVKDVAMLPALEFHTRAELTEKLRALRDAGHEEFVEALYRLLLGRPADPGGLGGLVGQLNQGLPRTEAILSVALSEEARRSGLPAAVGSALAAALGDLDQPRREPRRVRRALLRLRDTLTGTRAIRADLAEQTRRRAELEARLHSTIEHARPVRELEDLEQRLRERLEELEARLQGPPVPEPPPAVPPASEPSLREEQETSA